MSTIKIVGVWLILSLWAAVAQAGTHHHYYTDPQGTVLAKTDAQGNIIARYDYAPYGTAVASMNPAPNGPGYTGHVNDPESGLVYMQARYYDPVVGRFLSVDPPAPTAGNVFNFNRYGYGNNNPIGNIDPTGMDDCGYRCMEHRAQSDNFIFGGFGDEGGSSASKNETSTTSSVHVSGCDTDECDQYKATNKSIIEGQAEALKEAGIFAAKQAGWMAISAPIGKAIVRLGMFFKIGKYAELSKAAGVMDRNGLTRAGRALQKHSSREGSIFQRVLGHDEMNAAGQQTVDDILRSSGGAGRPNRFGGIDYIGESGAGARFNADGQFMGFLEP